MYVKIFTHTRAAVQLFTVDHVHSYINTLKYYTDLTQAAGTE